MMPAPISPCKQNNAAQRQAIQAIPRTMLFPTVVPSKALASSVPVRPMEMKLIVKKFGGERVTLRHRLGDDQFRRLVVDEVSGLDPPLRAVRQTHVGIEPAAGQDFHRLPAVEESKRPVARVLGRMQSEPEVVGHIRRLGGRQQW